MLKLIEIRAAELSEDLDIKDPDYNKAWERALGAEEKIRGLIPEDQKEQFETLDNEFHTAWHDIRLISEKHMYAQGFIDGVEMKSFVDKHSK